MQGNASRLIDQCRVHTEAVEYKADADSPGRFRDRLSHAPWTGQTGNVVQQVCVCLRFARFPKVIHNPFLLSALLTALTIPARGEAMPWKSITPRAAGLDPAALEAWRDALAGRGTSGLILIRRGSIAFEWYAPDWGSDKPHGTASLAKALVGGMSLLAALSDGLLAPDDPACKYIPAWKLDPLKSKITIRQLATHTSGIEDAEQDSLPHDQLPGWKGAFWRRSPDPFSIALQAPVLFAPGTRYAYSNPGMAALAYAVTASLHGGDIRTLLKTRIFDPLGIPESAWSIGYGRGYELDGLKLYANWGGASFTARAAARVGQLMMLGGTWNGRELAHRVAVKQVTAYAGTPKPPLTTDRFAPASGLAWYTNSDGVWPDVPKDAIAGAGAGHQFIAVIPSLDLIVVRNGQTLDSAANGFWTPIYSYILKPLMAAVVEPSPYPPSPLIRKVDLLPDIRRDALGSDNWPITWADDDAQYTSYGDGWGFQPGTGRKLGMGFARIVGPPDHFRGVNIRSAGERIGDGPRSPKASGMLMSGGVLYVLVRNVGNSQLLWSKDHGRTWESGFKLESGFGSPTFLNFGRNYAGARDNFIYIYSQDGPSAYESDNQLELARIPKDRITDRSALEFFQRLDEHGRPVWTRDIERHGAVFRYPGNCRRSDVVYNPGIRRYLLALAYNASGDWGLFDAPEPWGPWTTAFHSHASAPRAARSWDISGTHSYRLPAKWIRKDGQTMTLIFSGVGSNDALCTRTIRLEVQREARRLE
jgi:CubicO group peptidase (beta-lactamase class C family)